jgi:hypothetical protein
MTSCGPEGANDYSPGCQPGVLDKNRFNSEAVAENTIFFMQLAGEDAQ